MYCPTDGLAANLILDITDKLDITAPTGRLKANVRAHPPLVTFRSQPITFIRSGSWALLGSGFVRLILTDDAYKD